MKKIDIAELEENFDEIFSEVIDDSEEFVICEGNKPLVVLISYEDYKSLVGDVNVNVD